MENWVQTKIAWLNKKNHEKKNISPLPTKDLVLSDIAGKMTI